MTRHNGPPVCCNGMICSFVPNWLVLLNLVRNHKASVLTIHCRSPRIREVLGSNFRTVFEHRFCLRSIPENPTKIAAQTARTCCSFRLVWLAKAPECTTPSIRCNISVGMASSFFFCSSSNSFSKTFVWLMFSCFWRNLACNLWTPLPTANSFQSALKTRSPSRSAEGLR